MGTAKNIVNSESTYQFSLFFAQTTLTPAMRMTQMVTRRTRKEPVFGTSNFNMTLIAMIDNARVIKTPLAKNGFTIAYKVGCCFCFWHLSK